MAETKFCPCGSQVELALCCEPIIRGKKLASTAEALLRSRYTAFALGEIDYLIGSHHSKTVGQIKREEVEEWSKGSEWLGLEILSVEAGLEKDTEGNIIFKATYKADGKEHEHMEKSFFEKENGAWKFLDAKAVHLGTYKRVEPKIGRNDPCPCGSGKKFKKCCVMTAAGV